VKEFFYLAVISTLIAGCSPAANVEISNSNVQLNTVTNKPIVSAVNQPNTNVEIAPNTNAVVIQNSLISKNTMQELRSKKGRGNINVAPMGPSVSAVSVPAPDNSEVSSQMNKQGVPVETRTFKNHPVLVKVERTFTDITKPVMKIYLKNGKVVNVPQGKIADPLTASADEILKAVGVN